MECATIPTMSSTLTPVQIQAVSRVISKNQKKAAKIPVGDHHVDFLVRISGSIRRGADYETDAVQKAKPWDLLELALSKLNGVTVESLVEEALALQKPEEDEDEDDAEEEKKDSIQARVKAAIKKIKGGTTVTATGKTTAILAADVVPVVTPGAVDGGAAVAS